MTFGRINNRLARALGQIVACRIVLERNPRLRAAVREALFAKAQELRAVSTQFAKLLRTIEVGVVREGRAKPSEQRTKPRVTVATLRRQLASAVGLIVKNVRDLPTSSYDLRPTREELKVARHEDRRIQVECLNVFELLTRFSE